jgi:hypothetical protein
LLVEAIEQLGGSAPPGGDENALIESLRVLSRARAQHDRATLLIIDDAHELPAKTIERLGKVFGDDPAEPTRLHVLLMGRPELLDRMNAANDRTILKHLVQVCRVDPIGPEDSCRYIAGRVAKVGGTVDSLFTQEALRLIVARAGGNPARIDAICAAALERAEQRGDNPVGPDIVDLASGESAGGSGSDAVAGNGEGDAPFYVFGDDDGDDDEDEDDGNTPPPGGRRPGGVNGARRKSAGSSGGLKGLYESRRPLVLTAAGLVLALGLFAATMTDTGPRQSLERVLKKAPETIAGLTKGKSEPTAPEGQSEPPAAAAKRQEPTPPAKEKSADVQAPVAERPTATPKLVVHRDRPAAEQVPTDVSAAPTESPLVEDEEARAASAPVHAAPRKRPPPTEPPAQPMPGPSEPAAAPPPKAEPPVAQDAVPPLVVAVAKPAAPSVPLPAPPEPAPAGDVAPPSMQANEPAPVRAVPVPRAPQATVAAVAPAVAPKPTPTADTQPAVDRPVVVPPPPTPAAAPKAVAVATPAAPPQVAAVAAPRAPEATGARGFRYSVQLGAFKSRENAETLLAKAKAVFADATISSAESQGAPVFRVLSGSFTEKADAEARARTLAQSGFTTYVRTVLP